jgi:hypothetical protein
MNQIFMRAYRLNDIVLKRKAFIAYRNPNPAAIKMLILFSIDNYIANISLYGLIRPKLNFGYYLTYDL